MGLPSAGPGPESCPCLVNSSEIPIGPDKLHDDVSTQDFLSRHWWLLILLCAELLTILGFYLYHFLWTRRQQRREAKSGVMKNTEAYSLDLVKYFMPSIQVERYRFRGMQKKSQTISVEFEDLGLELHSGAKVLAGVTGDFPAGRLCAVMGPSGAGKTTFMNVLCGKAYYGRTTGTVRVNGEEDDIREYKALMGFVPQEDIVHEGLTVGEQIEFSAQLRSPQGTSLRKTQLITEDVLNVMQIDHIRNSIVGGVEQRGISGGQRKRVNIGLELAADPAILFLDEPTSGLDATSSLTIVHSLKKMTQLGMTSIMVIHQPRYSLFTLFDDVLLLGKGGRTVYLGSSMGAKNYFESLGFAMPADENPADWLMDVISGEVPNSTVQQFQPAMLFDMWDRNKERARQANALAVREWTEHDDRVALTSKLQEEWGKIDQNKDGMMNIEELKELLCSCTRSQPDDAVVRELFRRMASPGAQVVTKQEFIDFLVGLQGVVAMDRSAQSGDKGLAQEMEGQAFESFIYHRAYEKVVQERALMLPPSPQHFKVRAREEVSETSASSSDEESSSEDVRDMLDKRQRGCNTQLGILLHRQMINWWRGNRQRVVFLGVILFASVVLAAMDRFICTEAKWAADPYLNLHTALALLISVFSLGLFGSDRPVFWRESSGGLSVLAFYLARITVNASDLFLQCFLFASVYYFIREPSMDFGNYFVPFLLVTYVASGIGYFISSVLNPRHGPFVAALVAFVSCGLLGHPLRVGKLTDGGALEISMDVLSVTRWSVAMSFLKGIEVSPPTGLSYSDELQVQILTTLYKEAPMFQKPLGYWYTATAFLFGMGTVLHIAAFLGLRFTHRSKQV